MTLYIEQSNTLYKYVGDTVIVIPNYKSRDRVLSTKAPINTNNK